MKLIDTRYHNDGLCFARTIGKQVCFIFVNVGDGIKQFEILVEELGLKEGVIFENLLVNEHYKVNHEGYLSVKIPPKSGLLLHTT